MSDRSEHACFYIDTVTFRVEGSLFKVPREPFESESIVFRDMFLLPTGDLHEEGKSDENPIHLTGITKDEFDQLLSVLFHRTHCTHQKSLPGTSDQWTSVLKLAALWGFDNIRQVAIAHLKDMSPVDRIVVGETYDLDFESWILPAMHEVVRRHEPISVEEGRCMGFEMALKLASVRERVSFRSQPSPFGPASTYNPVPGHRPNVEGLDFVPFLRETFKTPQINLFAQVRH